jgi:hypothetical protein
MLENYTPTQDVLKLYDDFLSKTTADRLQKILARYELFKMSMDVPGCIVECGVFKGSGLYTLAKLQKLFKPNNEQRILGFDFFETNRDMNFEFKQDSDCLDEHAETWASQEVILDNMAAMGIRNVELVAGNVVETTKQWAKDNLGTRIALLYLDVDNYEGSLAILENLYMMVSPGGIVAFDEYAMPGYGESDAVDEFFRGKNIKFQTFPWANTPSAFLRKEL